MQAPKAYFYLGCPALRRGYKHFSQTYSIFKTKYPFIHVSSLFLYSLCQLLVKVFICHALKFFTRIAQFYLITRIRFTNSFRLVKKRVAKV